MRKTLYTLNIGNYAPEICGITYPLMRAFAEHIGAEFHPITERRFPDWDLDYEKLQMFELSQGRGDDWSIYFDSDALIHPDTPDFTELLKRDICAHNGSDLAAVRWKYDDYFRRDGRNIGSCCWCIVFSSWCRDMVRPLDDLTFAEALQNIRVTREEERSGVIAPEHLITDYAVSRNIARFGLHFTTLNQLIGSSGDFFWHIYTVPKDEKLRQMKETVERWHLG